MYICIASSLLLTHLVWISSLSDSLSTHFHLSSLISFVEKKTFLKHTWRELQFSPSSPHSSPNAGATSCASATMADSTVPASTRIVPIMARPKSGARSAGRSARTSPRSSVAEADGSDRRLKERLQRLNCYAAEIRGDGEYNTIYNCSIWPQSDRTVLDYRQLPFLLSLGPAVWNP